MEVRASWAPARCRLGSKFLDGVFWWQGSLLRRGLWGCCLFLWSQSLWDLSEIVAPHIFFVNDFFPFYGVMGKKLLRKASCCHWQAADTPQFITYPTDVLDVAAGEDGCPNMFNLKHHLQELSVLLSWIPILEFAIDFCISRILKILPQTFLEMRLPFRSIPRALSKVRHGEWRANVSGTAKKCVACSLVFGHWVCRCTRTI